MTNQCALTAVWDIFENRHIVYCPQHAYTCPRVTPDAIPVTGPTGGFVGYIAPTGWTLTGPDTHVNTAVYEGYLADGTPTNQWDTVRERPVPWSNRYTGADAAKAAVRERAAELARA